MTTTDENGYTGIGPEPHPGLSVPIRGSIHSFLDGDHVEVWRAGPGEDPERILEGQMATIMAGQAVALIAKPNCYATVDDYTFATADPGEYVARYNDANEMTMSADATGRTAYTYDAWGRTVTKQHMADPANTYTATYMYRFGDKLKRYDTNLPGEETGIYNYDGLGKRRLKLVDDDYTWFRWAGWSILSEYGEGTDPNTLWDIAATPDKVYTPGLAERTSSSDYAYYLQDHLGSTRQVLDGTKALQAQLDYTPYGEPHAWAGALPSMRKMKTARGDARPPALFGVFVFYAVVIRLMESTARNAESAEIVVRCGRRWASSLLDARFPL